MSTYTGPLPKMLERFREHIAEVDDMRGGRDGGSYLVVLRPGLKWADMHICMAPTITQVASDMRDVEPCDCEQCKGGEGQ